MYYIGTTTKTVRTKSLSIEMLQADVYYWLCIYPTPNQAALQGQDEKGGSPYLLSTLVSVLVWAVNVLLSLCDPYKLN